MASKHGSRGSESLLLGYDENVDGRYILWNVNDEKVRATESVHFLNEKMQPRSPKREKQIDQADGDDVPEEPRDFGGKVLEREESADSDPVDKEMEMPER
ncbi:hypothetical protein Cpir12675_000579 [Ceratocystis pirilliformis]|uniref:Uncharacterized protein n=1 Tax=Ceratocystis pirilliformis TaxID=259994 RepID=A0ABR3ZMZ5_9PEZI